MNMANLDYQEQDFEAGDSRDNNKNDKTFRTTRRPQYARKSRGPASFNGMHRRRNKRYTW